MKKFLSLLLTFAMVFSLAMPAMAAEVDGNTSSDVKASYTPTYAVNIAEDIENGEVEADSTQAAEDATVTLTVTPDEGYELENLTVTYLDENGDPQNVTTNEGEQTNTYTFTMPASAVTVTATFKEGTAYYKVNIAETTNGTVTAAIVDPAEGATLETVEADMKIKLTVTPADKYTLDKLTVTYGAENTPVTVEADDTFIMPASDVTVTATFKELPTISVTISWGSMSFIYSDIIDATTGQETGWTCDADANQVTVTNGNESAITASVEYKKATGYETINGYFAAESATASADLNLNEAHTFTLTLSGKPDAAITAGTTIGSVTVTITEYDPVYLNFSFESANGMTYKKHKIEFFDASDASIYVTEVSEETTNTVAVPSDAATFQILVDYSSSLYHSWDYYGSSKIAVPEETSNVVVTMPVNYTMTTVQ